MLEFDESGQSYKSGKLNVMEQFHVARRIAPIFGHVLAVMKLLSSPEDAIAPLSEALAKLSDEDSEYIIFTCCKYVERKDGAAWAKIFNASSKQFMYNDISLRSMIFITAYVIKDNLSDFFPDDLPLLSKLDKGTTTNP